MKDQASGDTQRTESVNCMVEITHSEKGGGLRAETENRNENVECDKRREMKRKRIELCVCVCVFMQQRIIFLYSGF